MCLVRKGCAGGTPTIPGCARSLVGNQRFPSRKASLLPIRGSSRTWPAPWLVPRHRRRPMPRRAVEDRLRQGVSVVEPDAPPRVNVLGVGVSAITMADALATIDRWIATRAPQYVCVTGVHGVMESPVDPSLRDIHNRAGLVTPDGICWCGSHGLSLIPLSEPTRLLSFSYA